MRLLDARGSAEDRNGETSIRPELMLEVIDSVAEWKGLSGKWNDLLKASRSDSPFLTWEWQFSWGACFLKSPRKLFLLAVHAESELVAIAPWYISRTNPNPVSLNQIECLGTPEGGADYLDVIIRPGREEQVADFLYDCLFNRLRPQWDCLSLKDIRSGSLFLMHFHAKMEREGKYTEVTRGSYCPVVTIPDGGDWMPAGVTSRRKARFRQDAGRLRKCGELIHRTVRGEEVPAALGDFFLLYGDKAGNGGSQVQTLIRRFASYPGGADRLQIDFLSVNDRKIAAFLHLLHGEERMLYLMAVDKSYNTKVSSGNVLIGMCLEQAHLEGCRKYDFLKGQEAYKFYWADDCRVSLSLFTVRGGFRPVLALSALFARSMGKVVLRHTGP